MTDSLLLKRLTELRGQAICLRNDDNDSINGRAGLITEVAEDAIEIETADGDRSVVRLALIEWFEHGPDTAQQYAEKRQLWIETKDDAIAARSASIRKRLDRAMSEDHPAPAIKDPEGFLARMLGRDAA